MALAARESELDLELAFPESSYPIGGDVPNTGGAVHADPVSGDPPLIIPDCSVAVRADFPVSWDQAVMERDAPIKHIALPAPEALVLVDGFEVLEDPSLELVHLLESLLPEIRCPFLAAYATGAEHRELLPLDLRVALDPRWELTESLGLRVDRILKRPDCELVIVPRIDHNRVWIRDQRIPICGR